MTTRRVTVGQNDHDLRRRVADQRFRDFADNVGGVPLSYLISGTLGTSTGSGTIQFNFSQPFPPFCTGSATATWSVAR